MKKETRTVVYDDALRLEAYRFKGIVQPFPSHFHEYYVIGFVEKGRRKAPADFLIQAPADEVLFPEKKGL